ncbi:MAG: GH92 family glycosyl hydrolase [Spirochaetales bacterium]|nr:GH92 family glycosyl hydrolase [Spirochaetales bacterium]
MKVKKLFVLFVVVSLVSCLSGDLDLAGLDSDVVDAMVGESHYPVAGSSKTAVDYVDPIIGSMGITLYGRVTPLVAVPFGMTHWVANTQESRISGTGAAYKYYHGKNIGFLGTHKPAVWMSEYGQVCIFPQVGEKVRVMPDDRAFSYMHSREVATPYYYSVELDPFSKNKITAEMTSTKACGVLRFKFPATESARILVEASRMAEFQGVVEVDVVNQEIRGWNNDQQRTGIGPVMENFRGWFVVKFSKKFKLGGTWVADDVAPGLFSAGGARTGGYIEFETGDGEVVEVRTATSFISIDQARVNMEKELGSATFDQIAGRSKAEWNNRLNKLRIEGATEDEAAIFYTAMYRSLLYPRQFSEDGKYYSAMDDKIHDGVSYTDYSLWDTFRAQHPLLHLIAPDHVNGMMQALVNMYKEGGWLPKWPNPNYSNIMIGSHADSVLADAVVNGFTGFDVETAYEAVYKNAMTPTPNDTLSRGADREKWIGPHARSGLTWYKDLGFVPADKKNESVSRTLEFAYDDYCVAQMAKSLGRLEDYNFFMERSKNYRNVYNEKTGFMAPRNSDGSWHKNSREGFTEGSPWTYLFCAMHDVPGLIDLFGGDRKFLQKLNQSFIGYNYVHENEPGHHHAYLYNWTSTPWKSQEKVRKYMASKYANHPFGLRGDDDCGQMSAWYIFSAMGFYPVAPSSGEYAIGTPRFPRVVVQFTDAHGVDSVRLEIVAEDVSDKNKYIQAVFLNGQRVGRPFLRYKDLAAGGKLIFKMGPKPNAEAFDRF